jgi:hypothetical protein
MRSLFFLFLVIPFFAGAQVNRSAKELASEKVREYIVSKLFRDKPYKPVSFGDIKAIDDKRTKIAWAIAHKFFHRPLPGRCLPGAKGNFLLFFTLTT